MTCNSSSININWIQPLSGITNQDLAPLFALQKADTALNSLRTLTKEAQDALNKVSTAIQSHQAHRFNPNLPFLFVILGENPQLYGLIFQWDPKIPDPLLILEWVFLLYQLGKIVTSCHEIISQS